MARRGRRRGERGVTMLLAAISLVAIIAISAISIEIARLTDTATEVQSAADAAALAAAENIDVSGDTATATSAARTVASRNRADGRAPAPANVAVEFGSWTAGGGYSSSAPLAGSSLPAVKATVTMPDVRFLLASALGASSTSVTKDAVAAYVCTGQAQPTAPITIGICQLRTYTQGQPCSGTGNTLTQSPDPTQNSCWTANAADAPGWFPPECNGGDAPLLAVGDTLAGQGLNNGAMVPILRAFQNCVDAGVHDYVVPIINCPIANCNAGTSLGQIVSFATMHIANSSDIVSQGPNKGITFTQICDNNGSGNPGPPGAQCTGHGNVRLVNEFPAS